MRIFGARTVRVSRLYSLDVCSNFFGGNFPTFYLMSLLLGFEKFFFAISMRAQHPGHEPSLRLMVGEEGGLHILCNQLSGSNNCKAVRNILPSFFVVVA